MIRLLQSSDLDVVCRHRERMFLDSGRTPDVVEPMAAPFRAWLQPRLADGRYFGFLSFEDAHPEPAGGIGLMVIDWPPHPSHPQDDRRGYVLNLYVEPRHRGRGVARALMARADAAFAERGVSFAILHATAAGRPLYEAAGWAPTTEMARTYP